MGLCHRYLFFAAMVFAPSTRGVPGFLDGQELVTENDTNYVRRKVNSQEAAWYRLKEDRRHLHEWETDRFLYEIVFKEDAEEPTEDDLGCFEDAIRDNMADIATDYLIKELHYSDDVVWGTVDEVAYRDEKARLEKKKQKKLKSIENLNKKQLEAQAKLEKEILRFEEEEKDEQEKIEEIMSEIEEETRAIEQQAPAEKDGSAPTEKKGSGGKSQSSDEASKLHEKLEDELLEREERFEEHEKDMQKMEEKLLGKLREKQEEEQDELEEIIKQLEELERQWNEVWGSDDVWGQVNCRDKKGAARRRCRKRLRRFRAIYAVKASCTFCRPENSDQGRYLLDEAAFKAFQAGNDFAVWMEDKMNDMLKKHCGVATHGVDYVIFSFDDNDERKKGNPSQIPGGKN